MEFKVFKKAVAEQFARMQATEQLFVTDVSGDELWALYLSSFPEGSNPIFRERTAHDCSCCKQFVRNAGNIVAIKDGVLHTIWDVIIPEELAYNAVAHALSSRVRGAFIRNEFLTDTKTIGTDRNFDDKLGDVKAWEHFFINVPTKYVKPGHKVASLLGETQGRFNVFKRGLETISVESLNTVIDLTKQNSLYRGAEFLPLVTAFLALKTEYLAAGNKDLFMWVSMPKQESLACIRNTAIGTLLVDLSEGMDLEGAVRSFEAKVAPTNYKRPTALVTAKMIEAAKAELSALGLMSALDRRYTHLEDITINNVLFADRTTRQALGGGVFDDLSATVSAKPEAFNKVEEIGIDAFLEHVLPRAGNIEVLLENRHANNMVSLIAPDDPTAPGLFKWNNGFSWSYAGDVTDSIKERVKAAGGNVTGEFRCSLGWFNYDDLDLSMIEPDGHTVYFANRGHASQNGGQLDVDMNALRGRTREAVENIVYSRVSGMRNGVYALYVHNFCKRESKDVGFDVEVCINGVSYNLKHADAVKDRQYVTVAEFTVKDGVITHRFHVPEGVSSHEVWGLNTMQFIPVKAIMLSPNYWDEQGVGNKHWFFMLDKCINPEVARGFYNEFLASDLDKHRKVMELVGSKMNTGTAANQLSGIGFSSTARSSLLCRVKGSFNRVIRVVF